MLSSIESEMLKRFLNVFETLFSFSTIDERWTIMFSKILIIFRSRILSIVHFVDHERETSLKEIERVRSVIELTKIRKCRWQISLICNLMNRFISEAYWWSISANSLIWCVKTVVSRNISADWRLKNVRVFAKNFQIRKLLTVDYKN